MGAVTKMANEHNVSIHRGRTEIHRDQAIVERFNCTLAERLFGHQYAEEMNTIGSRSTAWVKRLPDVVSAINNEVTRRSQQMQYARKLYLPSHPHHICDLLV